VLVANQPAVIGGPQKVLKTTIALDLALSMAAGYPWLGTFECATPKRVAVLSGESGAFTIQETARRVCAAKGLSLADLGDNLRWQFTLPQFARMEQLEALRAGLERDPVEVVIADPLYLSRLAGSDGAVRAENLYETGPLLLRIAQACLSAGATPALCHHTKRAAGRDGEPLDLTDLAFSGVAEFARQWLLLSRRKDYEPGTGSHQLWLNVGGSVGHGGLWAADVEEGVIDDNFQGRKWEVTVRNRAQSREALSAEVERKHAQQVREDGSKVLLALDKIANADGVAGYTQVRSIACLNNDRMTRATFDLVQAGVLEKVPFEVMTGKNLKTKKTAEGLRRVKKSTDGTDGTNGVLPGQSRQ
jgi:hypothetical protein